ncbi:hypothetical protein [Methanosphaera sp. BMS]|uniref:hypothetical protein n=1 Tax=Methanosphaera sp. BMS TaxID=1789762 RepID=UPI000DC1F08E|nr:hypothetical protein [Methanosphaera sp. BMS]AWX32477.1 hypothetical protein AW729_04885 [Methanosphaera sp. BMS]
MTNNKEELKLIVKCTDEVKYGKLYGLNQEIPEEEFEKAKKYMTNFAPADFPDIMKISGNPRGWMCTHDDAPKVEEALNITETLAKREKEQAEKSKHYDENRKIKEEAQLKLEEIFFSASRPKQKLNILLKVADVVYDPANSFRDNSYYGGGHLYIILKNSIWYIMNNGREENNWNINNIEIDNAGGAVGFKVSYSDEVHDLIKIVSEENIYSGETLKEEDMNLSCGL